NTLGQSVQPSGSTASATPLMGWRSYGLVARCTGASKIHRIRYNQEYESQPGALTRAQRAKLYREHPDLQRKYYEGLQERYNAYWNSEEVKLQKQQRLMDAAANVGNKIAGGTLLVIGAGTMAGAYIENGGVAVLKMLAKSYVGSEVASMLTSSGGPD